MSYPTGKTEKSGHAYWMRLENIVALTHARLLSRPCVSSFENIVFDPSKVKRGDLFVAYEAADIEEALQNGAYAVMFERPVQISDNEVAWLKVDSLQDALLRLLRFRLVEKEVRVYKCDEVTLKIASGIDTHNRVKVVLDDAHELIESLWDIESGTTILFCADITNEDLFTDVKELPHITRSSIDVVERTLFETSFIFEDTYFERVTLSPFFIPFLEKVLNLYSSLGIAFRLKRFETQGNFEIVFTNKKLEPKEAGTSEHVLIFEKSIELLKTEMEFLKNYAPWSKSVCLLPKRYEKSAPSDALLYEDASEIAEILLKEPFHFALIGGDKNELLERMRPKQQPKQLTFEL